MPAERTRRKSKLGRYMQSLRRRAEPELKPEAVAPMVRVAATTITRMEGGYTLPGFTLLTALLGIYGATSEERANAEQLWEDAKQGTSKVEHAADLPPKYLAFRRDESDAVTERTIDLVAVPGLLQTAGYAGAVAEAGRRLSRGEGWESQAAAERLSRQKLLSGEKPLRLHALIGEAVIRTVVGGPKVMAEQLHHLLAAGVADNVVIQIVPFSAGAWGTMSGPAIILGFGDSEDSDMVYLDYAAGGETVENERDVMAFVGLFADAQAVAASPDESADMIRTTIRALEGT